METTKVNKIKTLNNCNVTKIKIEDLTIDKTGSPIMKHDVGKKKKYSRFNPNYFNKNIDRNEGCRWVGNRCCVCCGCPVLLKTYCEDAIITQYIKIHLNKLSNLDCISYECANVENRDVYACDLCEQIYQEILKNNDIDYEITDNYL